MKKQQIQCSFITSMLYNINHGTPPTISKNAYQISIKTLYLVFRIEARTHPDPFVRRDLPVTKHSDSPLLIQHHLPAPVFSIRKMQKSFSLIDNGLIERQAALK